MCVHVYMLVQTCLFSSVCEMVTNMMTGWRDDHGPTNVGAMVKIEYVLQVEEILNFKGEQNCIVGSKVTAILLDWYIWPIGGFASGRWLSCLVFYFTPLDLAEGINDFGGRA